MEKQDDQDDVQIVRLEEGAVRITLPRAQQGSRSAKDTAPSGVHVQRPADVPARKAKQRDSKVSKGAPGRNQGSRLAMEEIEVAYVRKRRRFVTSGEPDDDDDDDGRDSTSDMSVTDVSKRKRLGSVEARGTPGLRLQRDPRGLQIEEMGADGQVSMISFAPGKGVSLGDNDTKGMKTKSHKHGEHRGDENASSGIANSDLTSPSSVEKHTISQSAEVAVPEHRGRADAEAARPTFITTLSTGATRIFVKQPPGQWNEKRRQPSSELQSPALQQDSLGRLTPYDLPRQNDGDQTKSSPVSRSSSMTAIHEAFHLVDDDTALYEAKEFTLSVGKYDAADRSVEWGADQKHWHEASSGVRYSGRSWEEMAGRSGPLTANDSVENISRGRTASTDSLQRVFAQEPRDHTASHALSGHARFTEGSSEQLDSATAKEQTGFDDVSTSESLFSDQTFRRGVWDTITVGHDSSVKTPIFRGMILPFQRVDVEQLRLRASQWTSSSSSDDSMSRKRSVSMTSYPRHGGKASRAVSDDRENSSRRKTSTESRKLRVAKQLAGVVDNAKKPGQGTYRMFYIGDRSDEENTFSADKFAPVSKKRGKTTKPSTKEVREKSQKTSLTFVVSPKGKHGYRKSPGQVRKRSSEGTDPKQRKTRSVRSSQSNTTQQPSWQCFSRTQTRETQALEMSFYPTGSEEAETSRLSRLEVQRETSFGVTSDREEIQAWQAPASSRSKRKVYPAAPVHADSVSSSSELTSSSSPKSSQPTSDRSEETGSSASFNSARTACRLSDSEQSHALQSAAVAGDASRAATRSETRKRDEERNTDQIMGSHAVMHDVFDIQKTPPHSASLKHATDTEEVSALDLETRSNTDSTTVQQTNNNRITTERHTSATRSPTSKSKQPAYSTSASARGAGKPLREVRLKPLLLTRDSSLSSESERLSSNGQHQDSDNERRSVLSRSSSNGFFTSESELGPLVTFPRAWGKRRLRPSLTDLDPFGDDLDHPDDRGEMTAKELRRRYSAEEYQPTSPFARRAQRFPSTRSEGKRPLFLQQHPRASHVRQLSLDIGEEWESVNSPRSPPPMSPSGPHDDQGTVFFGPSTSVAADDTLHVGQRKGSVLSRKDTVKRRSHQTSKKLRLLFPKPFENPLENMDVEEQRQLLSTLTPSEVNFLYRQQSPLIQLMHRQKPGIVQQRRRSPQEDDADGGWQEKTHEKGEPAGGAGQSQLPHRDVHHQAGARPVVTVQPMRHVKPDGESHSSVGTASQLEIIRRDLPDTGRACDADCGFEGPRHVGGDLERAPGRHEASDPDRARRVPASLTDSQTVTHVLVDVEDIDTTGKRRLLPNPYNRINQRCHSTLQCPCCFFFCFLCCAPAVYWMVRSDYEFDHGSLHKARRYGRRTTALYSIGAVVAICLLVATVVATVIFLPETLMTKRGW